MRLLPCLLLAVLSSFVSAPGRVRAEETRARPSSSARDGLYGRWDDDLVVQLGAGAGGSFGAAGAQGVAVASAGLRFFNIAGPTIAAAGGSGRSRHLFTGVELRPLFPGLFLIDRSTTHAFVDLLLQSISVELGAAFPLAGDRSVGLGAGLSVEVPLVYPYAFAQGVGLRLGARRVLASPRFQSVTSDDLSHWVAYAALVVGIGVKSGLAGAEPPRYR